jgi:hypothetical protein
LKRGGVVSENKRSAKQRQLEMNRSRRRWMTLFSILTGVGAVLLATMLVPENDRDDTENSSESTVTRPVND